MNSSVIEKPKNTTTKPTQAPPINPIPSAQQHVASFSSYSGPIPPPDYLIQYEKLLPGIAKKFLEAPYQESEHRRTLEVKMVDAQIKLGYRGQVIAGLIAGACVIGSFAAIYFGHSIEGLGTLLFSIGAFVGVFIYGKNKKTI
ncbi:MAG: DUF2335 domain-containing protein [Chlamydiae bacterium]|nr:DUF2335 domain-containing protein [Chlamydiota bacterium]